MKVIRIIIIIIVKLTTASLSGSWVPKTLWNFQYWQPAPRWRLHQWLAKLDNPAMSPHTSNKTGTHHTDKQWKVEGGPLKTPHRVLLLPTTPINELYNPKHKESDARASITKPLTTIIIIGCSHSKLLTQLNFLTSSKFRKIKKSQHYLHSSSLKAKQSKLFFACT